MAASSLPPTEEVQKLYSKQSNTQKEKVMHLWEDAYLASGGDIKSVMAYYLHHTKGGKQNQFSIIENMRRTFGEKTTKQERNLTILMEGIKNLFAGYSVDEDRIRLLEMLMSVFSKSEMQQRGILLSRELWDRARKNVSVPRSGAEADALAAVERFDDGGNPLQQLQPPHPLDHHVHHSQHHEGHHQHHETHHDNTHVINNNHHELHLNSLAHDVIYGHHHAMTAEEVAHEAHALPEGHGLKRAHGGGGGGNEEEEMQPHHYLERADSQDDDVVEEDVEASHAMAPTRGHHHTNKSRTEPASGRKRRKLR